MVTEQEIRDEAKKLGIELDDDKVKAHLTLNTLPVKGSSSSEDKDGEDDDGNRNWPYHPATQGTE